MKTVMGLPAEDRELVNLTIKVAADIFARSMLDLGEPSQFESTTPEVVAKAAFISARAFVAELENQK